MASPQLFSLDEMRAVNGNRFSDADYIHYLLRESAIGPDLLGGLVRFFRPDFERINGRFLLIPTGAPDKYREYRRQGKSPSEAQYWADLTEISGVFERFDTEQAISLADAVAQLWQSALLDKSCDVSQRAYKVEDKTELEIFVTISDLPGLETLDQRRRNGVTTHAPAIMRRAGSIRAGPWPTKPASVSACPIRSGRLKLPELIRRPEVHRWHPASIANTVADPA